VADKPDSHDVCFIADGDTRGFLAERLGTAPGQIVDSSGAVLGEHQGAYGYTIGQRKGLRIGDPAGDGRPRYVLDISPVTNTVTVGTAEELSVDALEAAHVRWCGPIGGEAFACSVQLRAHGSPVPAEARYDESAGTVNLTFSDTVRGIAPGQTAVLYDDTRVIGSATITVTRRATAAANG